MSNAGDLDGPEVLRGLIRVSAHLSARTPIATRMTQLCMETASILTCDRCSIMLWDGQVYRATYNWGNPPDIAKHFPSYTVPRHAPLIQQLLNSSDSFIVVNDAQAHPATAKVADAARIRSIVVASMTDPVGSPLGFMTAEYNQNLGIFGEQQAEVVLGAARLAQAAIVTSNERHSRRRLAHDLDTAVDDERRRLGREIHDEAIQQLFAMRLRLKVIGDETTDPDTSAAIHKLVADCESTTRALRDVAVEVHPETATTDGLTKSLQKLLDQYAGEAGWQTTVENNATAAPPAAVMTSVLLKIVGQALKNADQHANASQVTIRLDSVDGGLSCQIADDGIGFDPREDSPGRLGLISMRERANDINGTIDIESRRATGTTIRIWLPARPDLNPQSA